MRIGIPLLLLLAVLTALLPGGVIVDPEAQAILSRFIEFHEGRNLVSARVEKGEESICFFAVGADDLFARHRIRGFDEWKPYDSMTLKQGNVRVSSGQGWAKGSTDPRTSMKLIFPGPGIGYEDHSLFGFGTSGSENVMKDPLARDPFSGSSDAPSPAFPVPMLLNETGDILDDAEEVRYRGEETIGGIPCIKLEFHHARSAHPQHVWIASEGDPRLVQIHEAGSGTAPLRFSDWTFDDKVSRSLFGENHEAIRKELLDPPE